LIVLQEANSRQWRSGAAPERFDVALQEAPICDICAAFSSSASATELMIYSDFYRLRQSLQRLLLAQTDAEYKNKPFPCHRIL
jgi:hypothetical protein